MFKRLRIAILLYILLLVAAGHYLTAARSTDWDNTLWVDIYPLAGDGQPATRDYVDKLTLEEFDAIEAFFASEAKRYGVALERPFRLNLAQPLTHELPPLAARPSMLAVAIWSLRMRWLATTLQWKSEMPSADIVLFAIFHDGVKKTLLDRSTALEKGMIAVANLFADRRARGSNQVVLAHELLHTLGAVDKYASGTQLPRFPDGFADPDATPLFPQTAAEIMAGRIATSEHAAEIPRGLRDVVVGPATAAEIGWVRDR
jgi:hypothetical protein